MSLESLARTDTLADLAAREIRMQLAARAQSQAALARALGEPAMWLSERLNGRVQMTLNDLGRIAETLGVKVVDLLPRAQGGNGSYVTVASRASHGWADYVTTPPDVPVPRVGNHAHPDAPLAAGAVPIPGWASPSGQRKTAPTGR